MESKWFWPWFWGFGLLYFNAKFNLIQTRTAGVTLNFIPCRLFLKKFIIKGYSIEKLLLKSMKSLSPFIRKYSSCRFSLHITIFCFWFCCRFTLFQLMAAITSIYLVTSSLPTFQFLDFAIRECGYFFWDSRHQRMDYRFISTLMWFLNVVLPVIRKLLCLELQSLAPEWWK
jgi:hypothetical protein